jgi:hypothetical protein
MSSRKQVCDLEEEEEDSLREMQSFISSPLNAVFIYYSFTNEKTEAQID